MRFISTFFLRLTLIRAFVADATAAVDMRHPGSRMNNRTDAAIPEIRMGSQGHPREFTKVVLVSTMTGNHG